MFQMLETKVRLKHVVPVCSLFQGYRSDGNRCDLQTTTQMKILSTSLLLYVYILTLSVHQYKYKNTVSTQDRRNYISIPIKVHVHKTGVGKLKHDGNIHEYFQRVSLDNHMF